MKVLVTGASGYIGNRLVPRLLDEGFKVRAVGRNVDRLRNLSWANHPHVEIMRMDVLDGEEVHRAVDGCEAAYYLIHSMVTGVKDFALRDLQAAEKFAAAVTQHNLEHIIYLSGLGNVQDSLSKHLRSRNDVGEVLRKSTADTTIIRAAVILGAGSTSFEILRYLVDRLPVMITPRWVHTASQPIAIQNIIEYLVKILQLEKGKGLTYDVGGLERVSYLQLMKIYAHHAGLRKRLTIPVPLFTPRLSSYWIHLVTPIHSAVAIPLTDGLRNPAVCEEDSIKRTIPLDLLSCSEAIGSAMRDTETQDIENYWERKLNQSSPAAPILGDPLWAGGKKYVERRHIQIKATTAEIWNIIINLGNKEGYLKGDWLWKLRGYLDKAIGGPGLSINRNTVSPQRKGEFLDTWKVVQIEKERQILLRSTLRLPGKAYLGFLLEEGEGSVDLHLKILFRPRGLAGIGYWLAVFPFHHYVFDRLLHGIKLKAENITELVPLEN
jgi:uncharacterized protein YbjT (DUF2867 family)